MEILLGKNANETGFSLVSNKNALRLMFIPNTVDVPTRRPASTIVIFVGCAINQP
jgi:hypothetical protein